MNPELDPIPADQPHRFPCTQCGASLEYAPGASVLRCRHCGHENPIVAAATPILEQDFQQTLDSLKNAASTQESITIHCDSCGASYSFSGAAHAGDCSFCGSPVVAKTEPYRQLAPQALLPFKITRDQAWSTFRQWLSGLWFAPGKLKNYARNDARLTGMYVPYWTYDAATRTRYQGERGDNYQVQESYEAVENGNVVVRTRLVTKIRWQPVSGQVSRFFDDVLVLASRSLPRGVTERLEPWDLANLIPYQEQYLSGFRSEMYQIDLDQGFGQAREIMALTIRSDIANDIGGDHQRIHAVDTRYGDISFKHILLPVWMSAFRFRSKIYRFVINARTGEVQGERPYSPWKIAFAVLLGALVLGGGLVIWQGYQHNLTYYPSGSSAPYHQSYPRSQPYQYDMPYRRNPPAPYNQRNPTRPYRQYP